jgi:hypothetical protein
MTTQHNSLVLVSNGSFLEIAEAWCSMAMPSREFATPDSPNSNFKTVGVSIFKGENQWDLLMPCAKGTSLFLQVVLRTI